MITKEQKEHIFYLADEMRIMAAADAWEQSSWSSSRSAKAEAERDLEDSRIALEQYLESIMA